MVLCVCVLRLVKLQRMCFLVGSIAWVLNIVYVLFQFLDLQDTFSKLVVRYHLHNENQSYQMNLIFTVNANTEQSTEDNERSATVNLDNVVQEMEPQASARDNLRLISKFALADGYLSVNNDQHGSAETQNPNSSVLAHWRDIHEDLDSDGLDSITDCSHDKVKVITVPFQRSKGGSVMDSDHHRNMKELSEPAVFSTLLQSHKQSSNELFFDEKLSPRLSKRSRHPPDRLNL